SNTIYPTNIYSLEYDGFADFPQYPINLISDLNAFAGIYYVHNTYPASPSAPPPGYNVQQLPTSPGYTGVTNYYMITTQNGLPLLEPLRAIPVIGNPLADLLQPDLTTLVNIGYGSTTQGWSTGPANVPTPFGVIPPVTPGQVISALATGTPQGFGAFMNDVNAEAPVIANNFSLSGLTSMAGTGAADVSALTSTLSAASLSPDSIIEAIQAATTNVANGISGTAATLYAALLPTADIVNAVVTVIPAYDVNLFLSGIQQAIDGNVLGGLQYALVAPVAADAGLLTTAGGFELLVALSAL
ncbi:MAG: PE-PPE domain-containing protein, partial [Mycobacterium sp.]